MGKKPKGPNFDIPSMTYPQPWKKLPGPPPITPPAAPPISTKRLTWTTIAIAILIVFGGVGVGLLLRL